MDGYVLHGTDGEILLVVKSTYEEEILHLIERMLASRRKDVKELAWELEKSLYDNRSTRDTSKTRSKDKSKSTNGSSSRSKKAENTQRRTKSRT